MSENWGVVGIPMTEAGKFLVFEGHSENVGKQERVSTYQTDLVAVRGRELIGGAVEDRDTAKGENTLVLALLREAAEERGIIFSPDQLEILPDMYEVEQRRDGVLRNFLVASYLINLKGYQESWLLSQGAHEYTGSEELRPRDQVIINQALQGPAIPVLTGVQV